MAATTGVLMALLTTDWSRAINLVPAGNSSIMGLSSTAAEADLVFALAALLWTLRTNTNEGFRRSSDVDCAGEVEAPGAFCRMAVSEKSIFSKVYGPAFLEGGVVAGFGCPPIDGWVGRAVRPTSSAVTSWLPWASGCPVCAFIRSVTDPVCPFDCLPGFHRHPQSGIP